MKILYILQHLNYGGAEIFVKDLAKGITAKGHSVTIYLFSSTNSPIEQELLSKEIVIIKNQANKNNSIKTIYNLYKYLKTSSYDIIHTHLFYPQFYTFLVSKLLTATPPLVLTEHSTYYKRRKSFIYKTIDKLIYNRYNKIICVSMGTKASLIDLFPAYREKYITIYNGVDLKRFEIQKSTTKKTVKIVTIGSLEPHKNHILLLDVLKKLDKSFVLDIVGQGTQKEFLKKRVKELGLESRVSFLGTRNDIPYILQHADIYIQPSLWEGFGLVVIEAMASGVPVIVSNVKGMNELVENYGLLFDLDNPLQLLKQIKKLSSNTAYRKLIAEKCKKRSKEFSIENTVKNYINVYKDIV